MSDVINVNELHSDGYSPLMIAIGTNELSAPAHAQPHAPQVIATTRQQRS